MTAGRDPSIYGFDVRTREPLRFLRLGGGERELNVVVSARPPRKPATKPLADWALRGTRDNERATLYRLRDGYELWTTDAGVFRVDPKMASIEIPPAGDAILREQRLWGVPVMLCYMHHGAFSLHAAAVEIEGAAVLLAAPSLFGKTTLALGFHRQGYRILSEDLVCCRPEPFWAVLPGPAVVRVRSDVYDGTTPPGMHIIGTSPDRVFLGLDEDRKGSSAPVPVKAILFLRESDELRIERAPAAAALPDLWHLNFKLGTREHRARTFKQLAGLAASVPTWNVHRPLKLASLEATIELIAKHFAS